MPFYPTHNHVKAELLDDYHSLIKTNYQGGDCEDRVTTASLAEIINDTRSNPR